MNVLIATLFRTFSGNVERKMVRKLEFDFRIDFGVDLENTPERHNEAVQLFFFCTTASSVLSNLLCPID
jgi:hypothetical protein